MIDYLIYYYDCDLLIYILSSVNLNIIYKQTDPPHLCQSKWVIDRGVYVLIFPSMLNLCKKMHETSRSHKLNLRKNKGQIKQNKVTQKKQDKEQIIWMGCEKVL